MGIVIDIIVIGFILLSTFLGYKKGLINLGISLISGILSIIAVLILYRPIGAIIINGTKIDETIQSAITENVDNMIYKMTAENDNAMLQEFAPYEYIENATNQISENAIYVATMVILFIGMKILFKILITISEIATKLPVLEQFNKMGGIAYGLIRGAFIVCVILAIVNIFIKVNPNGKIKDIINSTYITKEVVDNNIINSFIPNFFEY